MMTRVLILWSLTTFLLMAVDAKPRRGSLNDVNLDRQYGDGTSPSPCPNYDSRPPGELEPNPDFFIPPREYDRPQTFGPSEFGNALPPVQTAILPPAPIQSSYPTPVYPDIVNEPLYPEPVYPGIVNQPVSPCGTIQQPSVTVVPVPVMLMSSGQPCNQPSCCPGSTCPETLRTYESGIIPQLNYQNRVLAGPSDLELQLQGQGLNFPFNPSQAGPGGVGSIVVPEPGGAILPGSRRPFAGMPSAPSQLGGGLSRPQGLGGQVIAPRAADNSPEPNTEEDNDGSSTAIANSEAVATSESDALSSDASKADASSTSTAVASSDSTATAGA